MWVFALASALLARASLACRALDALAGLSGEPRATRFAEMYRLALEGADLDRPLTPTELAGLRKNPFRLPESESGRANLRTLLRDLESALAHVDEAHRAALLTQLRAMAHDRQTGERDASHEREGSTSRPIALPQGGLISKEEFPAIHLLAGGRRFHSNSGLSEISRDPVERWHPMRLFRSSVPLPGEEWVITWAPNRPDQPESHPVLRHLDSLRPPYAPAPFTLEELAHPSAEPFRQFVFAPNASTVAGVDRNGVVHLFRRDGPRIDRRELTSSEVLGFSPDGRKVFTNGWALREGNSALIRDVATGEVKRLGPAFLQPQIGVGAAPDTVAVLTKEGGASSAGHEAVVYRELDAASGEERSKVEWPAPHRKLTALLGSQPVFVYATEQPGVPTHSSVFHLRVVSKATGEVVASGTWPGELKQLTSTREGSTIAIVYKTHKLNETAYRLETFDLATWLKNQHAGPANRGAGN